MPEPGEVDEAEEVRSAARELDHERYLAALLAPSGARGDLLAIAAFHGEIARIPASVTEPTIGAIRLRWWRDYLVHGSSDGEAGSPVANGLIRVLAGNEHSICEAIAIIDAYEELLYPGSMNEPGAVDAFARASQGAAFRLAAHTLGIPATQASPLVDAAAQSYGRVQLLRILPALLHKGHNPFGEGQAADWKPIVAPLLAEASAELAEVRRLAPLAPATILQAILPVALVEPYLKALEGLGSRVAFEQATISPLSRVWRIYLAKRRRRF